MSNFSGDYFGAGTLPTPTKAVYPWPWPMIMDNIA